MDLPRLMIAAAPENTDSLIEQKIKSISWKKADEQKQKYNAFMILDADKEEIRFEPTAWQDGDERKYYYLGNNASASSQIYVVRDSKSISNFWKSIGGGVLQALLSFLQEGQLYDLLAICKSKGLFSDEGINQTKIIGFPDNTVLDEKKKFKQDDKGIGEEKLLLTFMGLDKNSKMALIIPCIKYLNDLIIISQHADYINKIEQSFQGNKSDKKNGTEQICHICGKKSDSVNTKSYSAKFSRSSVSKIFVTQTINYAQNLKKDNHQMNFAICKDCYSKWLVGESTVMRDFTMRIAGEQAVVLFDGILESLDREYFYPIYKRIDIAFNNKKIKDWTEDFLLAAEDTELYEFHILFFTTNGQSCEVKKTIESVSGIRFQTVCEAFEEVRKENGLKSFGLGTIYSLIPVKTNQSGKQLNISRVLETYAVIFKSYKISFHEIMEWYAEAMDCGNRYIRAKDVRNESNLLNIKYCADKYDKKSATYREIYFREMTKYYLAFIELMKELDLLEGTYDMESNQPAENLNVNILEKENFLNVHKFSDLSRGLYYLGAVMYQVGRMQYEQGHKAKPILDKVSYKGMSKNDIIRLYEELRAKIQQYRRSMQKGSKGGLVYYAEQYFSMADKYLGDLPKCQNMTDENANLFYIMSGYSSCEYLGDKKAKTPDTDVEQEETDNG